MIIILVVLAATRASPVGLLSPPFVSLDQRQISASCDDPNGCRSLWDIIRSCILTILLCTYVSMHPNIPSPDENWPKRALRRAGLMLLALLVPEAVIAWALRQRQAAAKLAARHKGEGWTITHGFFATMGGFMEYEGNRPVRVLLPDALESYSLTGNGDFPRISKAEIEDKSKGDAISKGFVILQTGWFVIQCIARGAQHLPITELELVTVAFAALNFVICILWWDKPQNVQRGVRVYKKRAADEEFDDGEVEASVGFWVALRAAALSDLPTAIVHGPSMINSGFDSWLARVLTWPFLRPFHVIITTSSNDEESGGEMCVGTFYPGKWVKASAPFSFLLIIAITSAFGSIHCIGWSFTFPSSTEQTFWHVSSLTITLIPITIFPLALILMQIWDNDAFFFIPVYSLLFLYLLGRFTLLILPFLCLRSLPPAAFHVVHWASFIPHV